MAEVNPKAFPLADSALTNSILDLVQQVSISETFLILLSNRESKELTIQSCM
jgi:hypothetical protein